MAQVEKQLDGKVAIVTGASSGIGAAICLRLAEAGAKIAMAARREENLQQLREKIESRGGMAIAVKTDVTNKQDILELVKHTEYSLGPVDILVNNAGVMLNRLMKNLKDEEWNREIDINCKGVVNCISGVLDGMLKRKKGHIVNMSSDAGRQGFPGIAVYSGTKFFVEGLSQGMRKELASTGVKVTCIQPGNVLSELLGHATDQEAIKLYSESDKTKYMEPDDIGRAVLYAVTQPQNVAVNEVLIEPREAPI